MKLTRWNAIKKSLIATEGAALIGTAPGKVELSVARYVKMARIFHKKMEQSKKYTVKDFSIKNNFNK